jgi:hypothetical protein
LGIARLREIGKRGLWEISTTDEHGFSNANCANFRQLNLHQGYLHPCPSVAEIGGEPVIRAASRGLVKFFSAGQIATSRGLRQFRGIYFFAIFAGKPGSFMNQPALGIGIA